LADALRVTIHAGVLAHDVLDGFDEGADGHGLWIHVLENCHLDIACAPALSIRTR
jgi:hypothetical protein